MSKELPEKWGHPVQSGEGPGLIRQVNDLRAQLAASQASEARLREALSEAVTTMNHARVFIQSREKMHPDGQDLFFDCIQQAEKAL